MKLAVGFLMHACVNIFVGLLVVLFSPVIALVWLCFWLRDAWMLAEDRIEARQK